MASRASKWPAFLTAAVIVLSLAGILYWQFKPWASDAEKARLAGVRDHVAEFYQEYPPMPAWHIAAIDVARPGIVVALDMPAKSVALIQNRGAKYRLQAAGAICPEPGSPIYQELGRFRLEIHPQANGKPVLVAADCAKVRIVKSHA